MLRHRRRIRHFIGAALGAMCVTVMAMVATSGAEASRTVAGGVGSSAPIPLGVVQTSTVRGLYPGASRQLFGTFDNPNRGRVSPGTVTAWMVPFRAQRSLSLPTCTQSDFAIHGTATLPATVPSGSGVGSWSGLVVSMNRSAPRNCAGVSFTIDYRTG
jgi:hypothetical protein